MAQPNGSSHVHSAQSAHTGSTHVSLGSMGPTAAPGQETTLPHAFTAGTLHDPATGAWNMNTSASSHLNNLVTSLSTVFNSCMYPSVSVGDGHSIPVTNTGHGNLPTPSKFLHLNNVLITPHIVKNLISVFRDNNCTIKFISFGFSVKDFMTHRVLLRCDSTGDLYPIKAPSSIPHTFLNSQHMWHQHLGHPGSDVLRRLVSNNVISCNKEKPYVLFHACQLGKHVRLPFVSSNTIVTSCFNIIHSDVWTSHIPSLLGFKYFVLFLDHYSQFVWVYPLLYKFDVLSKFLLFRTCVCTQFKCEIRSFQCDHGGEFDNRNLHKLFAKNGIQLRFSCPNTSQQNVSSTNGSTHLEGIDVDETFSPIVKPGIFLSQKKYVIEILVRENMVNCNPSRTPVATKSKLGIDGDLVSDPTLKQYY
uniref:Ribonuclease H-like domain-containing protein n=1 Tax=Tanacetum cinerariifolium TaxID=118510 RepID=A0A6L2LE71_TANCI|nr:ribonuclease H-like domain-containing protein [Tanacetum cinerariifolium]